MPTIINRTGLNSPATQHTYGTGFWARIINIALGAWVFISAFAFNLAQSPKVDNVIVGAAIALVALWAIWNEGARYLNTALSVWLVLATVAVFKLTDAPLWSNVITGVIVFALSLVGSTAATTGTVSPPRSGL
jgi:hypothetical protein